MSLKAEEANYYEADYPPVGQKPYNREQGIWNILYKNTCLGLRTASCIWYIEARE